MVSNFYAFLSSCDLSSDWYVFTVVAFWVSRSLAVTSKVIFFLMYTSLRVDVPLHICLKVLLHVCYAWGKFRVEIIPSAQYCQLHSPFSTVLSSHSHIFPLFLCACHSFFYPSGKLHLLYWANCQLWLRAFEERNLISLKYTPYTSNTVPSMYHIMEQQTYYWYCNITYV